MAQQGKLETQTELKSSADKFFGFFKNNFKGLLQIFPENLKSGQTLEGVDNRVGCGVGTPMMVKFKITDIDDVNKTITYKVLDGSDLLNSYKSFSVKIQIGGGQVKWIIDYEKANRGAPDPDIYIDFATKISKALDAYLLKH
ncbi:Bet v I/Major latex protein [Dillenia turbinata]|uniref:Bet v I/Major latex protein n=1 Tax=Dillenia turbinata TaxID=194707 RepID=A0AAN8VD86_9MAGN